MNHNETFILPSDVLNTNKGLFCHDLKPSESADIIHKQKLRSVVYSTDYCKTLTIVYIPDKLHLPNSGVVCTNRQLKSLRRRPLSVDNVKRSMGEVNNPLHFPLWLKRKNLFECSDTTYILSHHVCDKHYDCVIDEDENNCTKMCTHNDDNQDIDNCGTSCHHHNCTCSPHYFQCQLGGCIPVTMICDCKSDCHD